MRRRLTLALLGASPLALACGAPPDRRLRVPLATLSTGGRRVVDHGGEPVELLRTETGVVARSLLCSHYGCRVSWRPERSQYVCACHQGAFDAEGRPVAGPPTRPLRPVAAAVEGDAVLVGEP
ncbi:MAG TPA: Rieske 2Fe-2S domain-containing protein [Vicinamibacteria bacterium]|nr:Rieske 2Fe-2S domain-containing protein [Vicinamibacteria bacterium]